MLDAVPAELDDIDLTDLDRFAYGFPHDVFVRLRRDAPVWWHPPTPTTPDGEGFWVLARHADIHAAAGDAATFSSATGPGRTGGGSLIEDMPNELVAGVLFNMMDDPRHHAIRKLVMPSVAPRRMRELTDDLRARTAAILDAVVPAGGCDLLVDVAAELPLQAIAWLMGIPQEDRHQLFAWANAFLDYDDRELGEASPKMVEAQAALFDYGTRLLAAKRADPGDDIVSILATGTIDGEPLGDLEQQLFFSLLVGAGSETTRDAIAGGVLALLQHPAQLAALRADRSLPDGAVEEILRWTTPDPYNRRTATRDVVVGDQRIAAGEKVTLWWASANRDDAVFADPFAFDIRRDPNPHLAFGHGTHFCLGARLARIEIAVVLDEVLDRLDDLALAGDVEWVRSNKHTGIRHMPVSFRAR
ncbi:MAG: cytochrome P450 [Acidimicrobiales bacterium]